VWGRTAENTAESLTRGARVLAVGNLRRSRYTTADGEHRTVLELELVIDEISPTLRHATTTATVTVTKRTRTELPGGEEHDQASRPDRRRRPHRGPTPDP